MTAPPSASFDSRSWLERLLRPIADVRAGEGAVVLLMALNLFLVLSAYYMLKTVRVVGVGSSSGPGPGRNTQAASVAWWKAKQAVDSFFWRAGDVISAIIVKVGALLAFTVPVFAAINVGFAVVWLFVVSRLRRENECRMAAASAE